MTPNGWKPSGAGFATLSDPSVIDRLVEMFERTAEERREGVKGEARRIDQEKKHKASGQEKILKNR